MESDLTVCGTKIIVVQAKIIPNSAFRIPNSEFNYPSRDVKNFTARSMLSLELPQSASLPLLR